MITLFGLSIAVVLLVHLVPGTIVNTMMGVSGGGNPVAARALSRFFGLDRPLYVQYLHWLGHAVTGNLGTSWSSGDSVAGLILSGLDVTAELSMLSILVAIAVGVPYGLASAQAPSRVRNWLDVGAVFGLGLPAFWVGSMMILVAAQVFHWSAPIIFPTFLHSPGLNLETMALPAVALGLPSAAVLSQFVADAVHELGREDYVRTARAKGLAQRTVLYRHVVRNAMTRLVTVAGSQLVQMLGGVVVIEQVFSLPGMGRLLINSLAERDYPVVQGTAVVVGVIVMGVNLIIDLLYAAMDPRVHYQ